MRQTTTSEKQFFIDLLIALRKERFAQDGLLPLWLVVVITARFVISVLAGLGSYVFFARAVKFGSTIWGKGAALAQCVYFLLSHHFP